MPLDLDLHIQYCGHIIILYMEQRKSMEIGTIIGNNGYFVDYLPIVQKMINSFEVINQKYDGQVPNIFYNIKSSGHKSC
jgi:hypothetical protein